MYKLQDRYDLALLVLKDKEEEIRLLKLEIVALNASLTYYREVVRGQALQGEASAGNGAQHGLANGSPDSEGTTSGP